MLHLDLPLPEGHPFGKVKVEVHLIQEEKPASGLHVQYAEVNGYRYKIPNEEEILRLRDEAIKNDPQVQKILEESAELAKARETPEGRAEFHSALKKAHGALENSKAWGKDVDVITEIRKMRNEWDSPWEAAGKNG
jgi:hypothetical protein